MAAAVVDEFRCFVGGLSWTTTDRALEDAFRPYGSVIEAKVVLDRDTERSRGFGFVTFGDETSMQDAIESMHGKDLDGRSITVSKAQPKSGGGGGRDGGSRDGGRDSYGSSGRSSRGGNGGGGGGGSGGCFKCGESGHWARDCTNSDGGNGGRDRYGSRGGDRSGSRGNGGPGGRYGGGSGGGERGNGYRPRDGGKSSRSGPYDRPSNGSGRRGSYDDAY